VPKPPRAWQWWIVAAAVPVVLCASKLNLDLWYDEVYTIDVFVSQSAAGIVTDYSAPNNHVFYSLLLRPFYLLYLASGSELLLRLPSLLFTVGTLAMAFRVARRWAGLPAGVLATLSLGLTQMFLVHTMQVRGYGLSMFLAAWLADLALPASTNRPGRRWAAIAVIGAAFLYVLPTNGLFLIPLGAVAVAWTASGHRRVKPVFVEAMAWAAACLLAGLLYWPILEQVLEAGGNRAEAPPGATLRLAASVLRAAARDWLPVLPFAVVGMGCYTYDVYRRPSREKAVLPLLTASLIVVPFVLTVLSGFVPFVRNYSPMLPFLAVAVGWLLACFLQAAGRLVSAACSDPTVTLIGMVLLAGVALPRLWTYPARLAEHRRSQFAQDGYYNYYAADYQPSEVVAYLEQLIGPDESYVVYYADIDHFPLAHYFRRAGMPLERRGSGLPRLGLPVVYVIKPELTDFAAVAGSARYNLPEEAMPGEFTLVGDFGYFQLYRCPWAKDGTVP
jgi:hypothetical protein